MARSFRYHPLAFGVHRGMRKGDLDGRESPCGWDCERRICESSFFFIFSNFRTNSSIRTRLTSVSGFALIRLPFIPLFILSLLYYELLWFSFLPSISLSLLSFTTESRFRKERALKFPRHSDTSNRFPPKCETNRAFTYTTFFPLTYIFTAITSRFCLLFAREIDKYRRSFSRSDRIDHLWTRHPGRKILSLILTYLQCMYVYVRVCVGVGMCVYV